MTIADDARALAVTLGGHDLARQLNQLAHTYDLAEARDLVETAALPTAAAALERAVRAAEVYTLIGDGGALSTDASTRARIDAIKALRGSRHPGGDIIADIDAKLREYTAARNKATEVVATSQVGQELAYLITRAQRLAEYLAITF